MGRILLGCGALLLLVTAAVHAMGRQMVAGWLTGFPDWERAAISLVWVTDSIDWAVVSLIWMVTAWRAERGWIQAAGIATLIPLAGGIGIMRIDPTFFGGQMVAGSVVLALIGLVLMWRAPREDG
jgi:hypothetical protein